MIERTGKILIKRRASWAFLEKAMMMPPIKSIGALRNILNRVTVSC
jgi:hypothetical protein